jgi:cyclophilin family peptidyl-prolyl cis-trans isomerase
MARNDAFDGYLSGDQFFIFKFSPEQAGLSGLAFDEGEFGVFGYVTSGMDEVVAKLDTGDKILSASLVSGAERLINAN